MKKTGKIVLIALVVLVAAVIIVGAVAPKEYAVTRSITIDAPAADVYENVYYFSNFNRWSPWYDKDTTQTVTIEGNDGEVGSKLNWESANEEVGKGYLERKVVEENKTITNELGFVDFEMKSTDSWIFAENNGQTTVTWTNSSSNLGFIHGLFFMFNDPDKMMGPDFEEGLSKLKTYVESHPKESKPQEMVIEFSELPSSPVLTIREKTTADQIGATLGKLFGEISQYMEQSGLKQNGAPFAIYYTWNPPDVELEAGISTDKLGAKKGNINAYETKVQSVAIGQYYGPFEGTEAAHEKINVWIAENGKEIAGSPIEVYQTDPMAEPDTNKWRTDIIYPVK